MLKAADLYGRANGTNKTEALQAEVDAMAEALKTLLGKQEIFTPSINVPVTFYDFRSDGLMFEAASGAAYSYMLEEAGVSPSNVPPFPGVKGSPLTNAGWGTKTMGLVEDELVNGQLVYKEKTIEYLAWLIARGYCRQFADTDGYVNRELYNKVIEISAAAGKDTTAEAWTQNLGSWTKTLANTDTGKNGGYFPYSEVETAFDLAYYIATNMWRPVPEDDIMEEVTVEKEDGTQETYALPYNLTVNNYDYLRMVKDFDTGAYTITSYSPLKYQPALNEGEVGLIYNPDLSEKQTIPGGDMCFIPMGGSNAADTHNQTAGTWLGFDGLSEEFQDKTDLQDPSDAGRDQESFHFAMHAHGSFVYQKALNQYFYFLGDDDVYYFVNGKLAMDLGGGHPPCDDILYLNDVAAKLGLKDGGVYTFDMFYIERHTNESNMSFSTNIQIMDTTTITTEKQFNGEGEEIPAGTKVEIEETITYQYGLENTRDVPVKNLIFTDDPLGVTISPTVCIMNNKATNSTEDPTGGGNQSSVGQLTLYYCGENKTPADANTESAKTFGEIKAILTKILNEPTDQNQYPPFGKNHVFSVTGLTADQLMELMRLGLPVNCGLFIKGFTRDARPTDNPFVSKLYTFCEYDKADSNGNKVETVTISGIASVSTVVYTEPIFVPDQMRVVIDYGKPVDLPLSELEQCLVMVLPEGATVTKTFQGISGTGSHGMVSQEAPKDLGCQNVDESYSCGSSFGSFLRTEADTLCYTPAQFLSTIARVYGVYRVDVVSPNPAEIVEGADSVDVNDRTTSYYVSIAIEIIPATMMYYEAEDFTGSDIKTVNTTDGGKNSTPWATEPDGTDSADVPQDFELLRDTNKDMLIDRMHIPEGAFFVDFDGEGYEDRYKDDPVYGGQDFDTAATWWTNNQNMNAPVVDQTKGTLSVTMTSRDTYPYVNTKQTATGYPLRYSPTDKDYAQIRFKLQNFRKNSDNTNVYIRVTFKTEASGDDWKYVQYQYPTDHLSNEDYVTLRIPMNTEEYLAAETIYAFRFTFINLISNEEKTDNGKLTVDYFYVGPEKGRMENIDSEDCLFFDFTDSDADDLHYSLPIYGGKNYDLEGTWVGGTNTSTPTIENGILSYEDNEPEIQNGAGDNVWPYTKAGLAFIPGENDYCEIRLKIHNAVAKNTDTDEAYFRIDYKDENQTLKASSSVRFLLSKHVGKDYFTLRFPMNKDSNNDYVNSQVITQVRPVLGGTNGATVSIDYLYIGPMENATPAAQSLYFGFDNSEEDRERYDTDTYKHVNYDAAIENWRTGSSSKAALAETCAAITFVGDSDNYWTGFYTNKGLDFRANEEDVVQVRVKIDNAVAVGDRTTYQLALYYTDSKGNCKTNIMVARPNIEQALSDGWCVYTVKLKGQRLYNSDTTVVPQAMYETDMISSIALATSQVRPIDKSKPFLFIDYIYVGPAEDAPSPVYGHDSGYANDTKLSNGNSLYVEGLGVKVPNATTNEKYSQATFSFTGTGFDIISRTNETQGNIRVSVYADDDMELEDCVKALSVNMSGVLDLYQIPVVSIQGLPHATYYVSVEVNHKLQVDFNGDGEYEINYGNEFYFDAIRIYDPIDVSKELVSTDMRIAYNAYHIDREANSYIKEIRDTLLSAADFSANNFSGATSNALFVDTVDVSGEAGIIGSTDKTTLTVTDNVAANVSTYNKVGPKNEIYLSPGQAVSFKLVLDSKLTPTSIDIGAKSILGDEAKLAAGFVVTAITGDLTTVTKSLSEVKTSTGMYYSLDVSDLPASGDVYLVIYNSYDSSEKTKNILSITDLKICYDEAPTNKPPTDDDLNEPEIHTKAAQKAETAAEPYRFMVDDRTLEAAAVFIKAVIETPVLEEGRRLMHSLNLASDISINYVVPKAELEGCEELSLEVSIPEYYDTWKLGYNTVTLTPVDKGAYYYFTLEGLTAVQMGDEITATLHMKKDGKSYFWEADTYSIAQYAYAQLNKESANKKSSPK
ncbi:MAG: fibro-slime domain-containing protein [Oscillospiraceae bacterium]|nr:fibro-slime domain-containing protein [Oscillospiraceae bacterium]